MATIAVACALLAAAMPSLGVAQPAQPAPPTARTEGEKRDTARRYVDAGLAAEQAKDYAAAVDFYLRAYDLVPHPLLIYNMAEAHRLAGHNAEALAHFKRYLAADPTGPRVKAATDKIPSLEQAEAARLTEEARLAEQARLAEEARLAEQARLQEAARAAQAEQAAERKRREQAERELSAAAARAQLKRRADTLKLTGIGVGAVGVAGLALGGYFGQRASQLSDSVSARYDADNDAEGVQAQRNQIIALAAGGTLTVAGATILFFGWRKGRVREATTAAQIAPQPGGAIVSVTGGW